MSPVPEEAAALLRDARVMAHLATCTDGRPHVAPVWYVYGGDASSAERGDGVVELTTDGRKLRNVRENPRVALSFQKDVDGDTRWMVSLLGTATVVEDEARFREVNRRINEKYGAPADAHDGNTLVRVEVGTASYRTY